MLQSLPSWERGLKLQEKIRKGQSEKSRSPRGSVD